MSMTHRAVLFVSAAATAIILNCDAPVPPTDSNWFLVAPLPRGYSEIATPGKEPGDIYALSNPLNFESVSENGVMLRTLGPVIYHYDENVCRFVPIYECPLGANAGIFDLSIARNDITGKAYGWAVGGKGRFLYNEGSPLLLKYDGVNWEEVPVTFTGSPIQWQLNVVDVIDEDECWVQIGGAFGRIILQTHSLYKCDNGKLTYQFGDVYGLVYDKYTGRTWAGCGDENRGVYISDDKGLTWVKETPDVTLPGYDLQYCWPVWVEGNATYFCAAYTRDAYGLLVRTGPLGMGEYRLLFLSDTGPNFFELRTAAEDGHGRILAAGSDTTVIYDDGVWYTEEDPCPRVFYRVWAAGSQGWYGVAENGILNRVELLYHP